MTQSGDFLGISIAADRAGVSGITSLGAGGIHGHGGVAMTQSSTLGGTANGAGLGGVAGGSVPAVAQSGNLIGDVAGAADAVGGGVAVLGAGGVSDLLAGSIAGVPAVMLSAVQELGTGLGTGGLQIGAVAVFQPGGGDIHDVVGSTGTIQAVGHFLNARAVVHDDLAGLIGGDDGRAAADGHIVLVHRHGGIQEAVAHHGAVDIDDDILQVTGGTLVAAGGGRIGGRHQRDPCEDIGSPVVPVVDVDIVTGGAVGGQAVHLTVGQGLAGDVQGGTLVNIDLNAGLQGDILGQADGAGMGLDGNVAVEAQNIVGGVELGGTHHQVQNGLVAGIGHIDDDALNGGIAVEVHHEPVRGGIVILYHIAVGGPEHAVGTDKFHSGSGNIGAGNGHGGKDIFGGTGVNGQGHLDILDIILGYEEGLDVVIGGVAVAVCIAVLAGIHEAGEVGAAGEVGHLHGFIDLGAGGGVDGAVTVDVAPDIQLGTAVQGNVGVGAHVDGAVGAAGAAAVGAGRV